MTNETGGKRPWNAAVSPGTRLGPVHLAVTDAERALAVWRDMVGLRVVAQDKDRIALGAGGMPLIILHPGAARPVVENTSGLYHVAIHVPARRDLAVAIARLFAHKFRNSPTDHLVTETTYLWDLDGNGIELTFETPWRGELKSDGDMFYGVDTNGRRHSGRDAVDLDSMFAELKQDEDLNAPLSAGTRVGHVHLHVDNLDKAMGFYADTIGFERQMLNRRFRMGDVNLDYPPHIMAFNTWAGEGAPQPPPDSAGLRWFTIETPDEASRGAMLDRLAKARAPVEVVGNDFETRDPAGNRLRLTVA